ncbi:MAG: response regulator [Cyclobacteriaceae bacterium]|nr:response regulator [Cyclobacteriaceae bacterium]
MKLLHKIKGINKGIQVIILTASNKAWNMKALLDAGADGYFIKESPEIPVSDDASKTNYDNLVKAIKEALDKNYLKVIDKIHKKAIEFIDNDFSTKNTNYQLFYDRARSSLDIAFELLKYASKDNKYFNLAYLTYYQILEDYTNQIENFEFVSTTECYVNNRTKRVISLSSSSKPEWALKYEKDRNRNYFQRTVIENEFKVESLAKISFVLAFKHHKDNAYLKSFGRIHQLRNTKAAHGGGSYITIPEIMGILDVVKLFFNPELMQIHRTDKNNLCMKE